MNLHYSAVTMSQISYMGHLKPQRCQEFGVCCTQLRRNATEVLQPFKTFTETFSSDFSDIADLLNQLCSLKEALQVSKN